MAASPAKRVAFCTGCVMPGEPTRVELGDGDSGSESDESTVSTDAEMELGQGPSLGPTNRLLSQPPTLQPIREIRSDLSLKTDSPLDSLRSDSARNGGPPSAGPPLSRLSNLTRHGSLLLDRGRTDGVKRQPASLRHSLKPDFLRHRLSSRRVRNRLVQKHGECNVSLVNVPKQRRKYFSDIFTTLVDVRWRWCLLVFALGFLLSWLVFSVFYFLVMLAHGDVSHSGEAGWEPCIEAADTWVAAFIFSVVTQHTIGYGRRVPTERCPEVLILMCIQAMVGVMIQTLMAGVVFAKIARPKKRAETLIFSKNAVICMRDSELCLLFRVGDMRKSQLAEAHVRLQMIKKQITAEGELQPFHQFDMNVGYDEGLDRIFVVWPITICHVIDEKSPLYGVSAQDLASARFEIIVILEGVVQSTGSCTQAKTSYLPSELLWGHRFQKLVTYQRDNGEYRIDFSRFHATYPVQIPTVSAATLHEMRERGLHPEQGFQTQCAEEIENGGATPYATVQPPQRINRPTIVPAGFTREPGQPPASAPAVLTGPTGPAAVPRGRLSRANAVAPDSDDVFLPLPHSPASLPAALPAAQLSPTTSLSSQTTHLPVRRKVSTNRGHDIG